MPKKILFALLLALTVAVPTMAVAADCCTSAECCGKPCCAKK
jgi:hypothetical protein